MPGSSRSPATSTPTRSAAAIAPQAPLEAAGDVIDGTTTAVDGLVAAEDRAAVRRALELLTAEQREVVVCKYVLGYDNARTAELLGKNANAVNQLHFRAVTSLRKLLGGEAVAP